MGLLSKKSEEVLATGGPRYAALATTGGPSSTEAATPAAPTAGEAVTPIHAMYSSSRSRDGHDADQRHPASSSRTNVSRPYDHSQEPDYPDSRRGSYMEGPPSTSRPLLYGQGGGTSPIEDDRASGSNESNSSGDRTKVGTPSESRSPSGYKVRNNGSDSSHHGNGYSGDDVHYSSSMPGFPTSPSSAYSHHAGFGDYGQRYRQGSYTGSGVDSARASTIGTDTPGNMPYNSSRVALNQEWRNSGEIHDGIVVAPNKDRYYGLRDSSGFDAGEVAMLDGSANEKRGAATYVPIPPSSPAINAKGLSEKRPPVGPDGKMAPEPAVILSRANRLAWIDGLRGLASVIIFTHHFSDLTWSATHPDALELGTIYGFIRNGQLAVGLYFLLGGRVLAHSFLRSAFTKPKPVKDASGNVDEKATKASGPKWLSLSSSLFRRSIRLALPAIVIGFIQWRVASDGLVTDTPIEATQQVLNPTSLWEPAWANIGNWWGFLQFTLDLFSSKNHMYMLSAGSALWTTYDQFWGSVLVYITAAVVAQIPFRGRQIIYLTMLVSFWFINSPNFLYIAGLWLSDMHACGAIRKVQDHWKPTMAIEIIVMGFALAVVAGGRVVGAPIDLGMANVTVYQGKFGWVPDLNWPQYMFFSNWLPPTAIMIWVELSHAMQWFTSWAIFVWLGKVSYGFYLCQFLTLFGVMPHLVLYFAREGKTFWNIIIPTYIICLIINLALAWVSYHLLDRLGLKLGKWIWDGFFVTKPKNAAALPLKMVRAFGHLCIHGPGNAYKSITSSTSSTFSQWGHNIHTTLNWRTPTTRPPVPDPTDPDMLAQLHSTRWTSDLSNDREAVRTYRLLRWQGYAWVFHMFWIPGLTFVWTWFHPTGPWTYDALTFSTIWRFVWILSVPNCLAAFIGFLTPDYAHTKATMDKKPVHREYIRNFFVLLVTKGSNESAVRRGYNYLLKLERYHPAVKVIVLTDEPYVYPDLKNIVCPKSYKSPLGKAKYKARALDYFRYHVSLGVYDWILHCDEESTCDAETIRRCFEFIRYTTHHFGQGIILYNGEGYWDNWLFTVADGIRVGDDLARFHFQNTVIKRPVFGVHGSFLMTNGEMENECTWDFGSLAEDFEFSQDAWRRGFTCGRIHGIVREQSPTTVRDFLKQRRRWFMGIRDIKGMYGLPHLAINLWIVGVFTLAVTLVNFPFVAFDHSLTPLWVAASANFCFMTFYTLYLWGIFFQELDYGTPWWKIIIHMLCAIPIQPFASVMEGLSAIWAMSSVDFGKFEVIVKK